jgi:26S proteasome regulatory subunit N4
MTEPLTDAESFPRTDIDVHQVRAARHQIICLQNDRKALLKEIEKGLEVVHSEQKFNNPNNLATNSRKIESMDTDEPRRVPPQVAFLKVNLVSPGSPAETAGLQVRDEILEFGTINAGNFKELPEIGQLVQACANKNVNIRVKRNQAVHELILTPKAWSGRGLLGCNVVPMDSMTMER